MYKTNVRCQIERYIPKTTEDFKLDQFTIAAKKTHHAVCKQVGFFTDKLIGVELEA